MSLCRCDVRAQVDEAANVSHPRGESIQLSMFPNKALNMDFTSPSLQSAGSRIRDPIPDLSLFVVLR